MKDFQKVICQSAIRTSSLPGGKCQSRGAYGSCTDGAVVPFAAAAQPFTPLNSSLRLWLSRVCLDLKPPAPNPPEGS